MDNIVKCDYCSKEFEMDVIERDNELYFKCKHCNHKYHVSWTNDQVKEYQQQIKDLIDDNNRKIQAMQQEIQNATRYNPMANVKPLVNKGNKLNKKLKKRIRVIQGKIKAEIGRIEKSKQSIN